jgi:hypothetical protein
LAGFQLIFIGRFWVIPEVTRKEKLTLVDNGKGSTSGSIDGTMAFDRNDYGMNSGIPFIKIANRVEVNVSLRWKWVSGPPSSFRTITKESYRSTLNK